MAESEYGARHFPGAWRWLLLLLAGGWSVFQLLVVKVVDLNAIEVRCAHLAFGLILVFLCFPTFKRDGWLGRHLSRVPGLRALGRTDSPPWIDLLLGVTAAVVAMYYVLDAEGVAARQGAPSTRDLIAGGGLILLLLEAARRALGPALPIVALAFMGLSMVSESLGPVAWREADLEKVIGKVALTIEGILGKPLDVSANTVFLYVLFGAMLDKAGAGAWFIDLAFGLVGRMRGGAAKAAVLASGFTGIISGSSIANVVTTGTFTIPLMVRAGYPPVKAGAVEVAASTNGQLMPPIMGAAAFIIAEYTGLPFHQVVIAAALPAVLSYLALFYITHLEACRLNLAPVPKDQLPPVKATFMRGLPYLLPLGLLLYLLMIERISPQLAAFWAIMCLAGIMLIWRGADALRGGDRLLPALGVVTRDFGAALVQGGRNMMGIAVAVAAAGIIVGIVTLGLGGKIVELIAFLSGGNLVALLLITAVVSLILGMGLPTTANYVVMATLTVPVIVQVGGDMGLVVPAIAAHLFCFYFGILADDTPPVGLAAYAAAAISRADPIRTGIQGFIYDMRTAILPFMFLFNHELLLIGVDSFWHGAVVALTGLVAMLAFANASQRWLLTRAAWWEIVLLLAAVFALLRPDLAPVGRWVGWLTGLLLYGLLIGRQWWVQQAIRASNPAN